MQKIRTCNAIPAAGFFARSRAPTRRPRVVESPFGSQSQIRHTRKRIGHREAPQARSDPCVKKKTVANRPSEKPPARGQGPPNVRIPGRTSGPGPRPAHTSVRRRSMAQSTVILHGWSDCSESFVHMKSFLANAGVEPVSEIYYADYESREDHLTFDDVVDGLNDEFYRRGFIARDGKKKRDLNVIVHSTGGLVIRHWINEHYYRNGNRIADCPVKRIVMLAPANFGSPLAHRGKSFLGSLFKGRWKIGDLLEVGRNLLDGLELASPYQWELAHRDLLVDEPYFNREQIQLTILVGIDDY